MCFVGCIQFKFLVYVSFAFRDYSDALLTESV